MRVLEYHFITRVDIADNMRPKRFTETELEKAQQVTKPAALQTAEGHVPHVSKETHVTPQDATAKEYIHWYVMDGETVLNRETGERSK